MSIIQHQKKLKSRLIEQVDIDTENQRIKIYGIPLPVETDFSEMLTLLKELAQENNCSKIMFQVKKDQEALLIAHSFQYEAKISGFFQGEDAYIYSWFLDADRGRIVDQGQVLRVMDMVREDAKELEPCELPLGYTMRSAVAEDAEALAKLYDTIFETYPTPMNDPVFVRKMMKSNVHFSIVEYESELVSACSADFFPQFNAVEMTDCATLPEHRGQGLLSHQFAHLEEEMIERQVDTLFSVTRAVSVGMNLINVRNGYEYSGRLIQNTNISGRLEDMNIWVKKLSS